MDDFTENSFANRGSPVPVIAFGDKNYLDGPDDSDNGTPPSDQTRGGVFKKHAANFKDSFAKGHRRSTSGSSFSMQDRLLERLLQQVIPSEDPSSSKDYDSPSAGHTVAPPFNLTTMSANFRRFNSRIGVVFVFQVKVARLLSWRKWSHTLSLLAVYTFICLDPYLIFVVPFLGILLALLIPSFITRHPAAPTTVSTSFQYSPTGPPLAPAPTVKPVKELSRDFFRNMRDLQNSMEDFSRVHDQLIALLNPPTNFSDEPLSSTVFLFSFIATCFMFVASHLIPWRFLFLGMGWAVICGGHPAIQTQMQNTHKEHVVPHEEQAKSWLDNWIAQDIILDSAPETREVEIFELQRLSSTGEWESWVFSPSPYDPLSAARIRSDRPQGTRFFEDVQPPEGWEWSEKKWALDLWSREWVEERIITGVEIETEGERWVYDIRYEGANETSPEIETPTNGGKGIKMHSLPSWEEGSDAEADRGRRGQWRRRRWVRVVKRKWQDKAHRYSHHQHHHDTKS
ncbi:hypothetical protein OIDMADRAFT_113469 [Oidiodendron maius Zn]|uniref:TECPR1-like DysF domain-containing protein n=1 Tax=Oidiodendron maius (strain Zn) TaxID=913774 RepID=A0A0C3HRS4_OIDMZ|nr:hypothetical protein OIDMADRAFT_113469 [Oidiodendron maius Zn]